MWGGELPVGNARDDGFTPGQSKLVVALGSEPSPLDAMTLMVTLKDVRES